MNNQPNAASLYPVIKYRDVPAAVAFLERAFGFEQWLVVPRPDGSVLHAELALGAAIVMLSSFETSAGSEMQSSGIGLYLAINDVDAHCELARSAGAEILMEPFDTDYGSRDYQARDLEGYSWYFGTYRPARPTTSAD